MEIRAKGVKAKAKTAKFKGAFAKPTKAKTVKSKPPILKTKKSKYSQAKVTWPKKTREIHNHHINSTVDRARLKMEHIKPGSTLPRGKKTATNV